MTLTIIVAIVAFLAVTLVLVGLLLYAKAKLTSSGDVTIDINDGEKVLTTESGSTLLVTLANNNVFSAFRLRRRRFVRHVQMPGARRRRRHPADRNGLHFA